MTMSRPHSQSEHQEPRVVDLEDGDQISHGPRVGNEEDLESATPDTRLSKENEHTRSRGDLATLSRCQRLWNMIPQPVATRLSKAASWFKGPQPPRVFHIKPLLEPVQMFPARLVARLPKIVRAGLLFIAFALWIIIFSVLLSKSSSSNIAGFGFPVKLSCINRLWPDPTSCGLDGTDCLPFDNSSFAFNCPADCASTQVLNSVTIGDEQIIYRPLVVGGTSDQSEANEPVYRGDSFICGAAIHAGLLENSRGGCGVLTLAGEKPSYGSIQRNGISSVGFNSSFPLSFEFNQDEKVISSAGKCRDPRWDLLILSAIFTSLFSLFATSPATFFVPIFIIVYFQIAMASDPPAYSDYPSLASTALSNFLPAAFIGVVIYHICVRKTLKKLNAHIEQTILWVGACWVGALSDVTLELIPLQRLTGHDLKQQPGAVVALVVIVLVLVAIAISQAWCFRIEGRLPRYLGLYAILGIGLLILLAMPDLDLRIHHYILALLLLPGTSMQTRPSLLYQGLLVGLFINGVARWGFASILQTSAALQGDALVESGVTQILAPIINTTNITFAWDVLAQGYQGVSVLVNDVERFRGFKDGDDSFTWTRLAMETPEYFRFGFVSYSSFGGVSYSDFTKAGIWWPNGTWVDIPPGAT